MDIGIVREGPSLRWMMKLEAPKGLYRVIGLDPVDTLTGPSGPLWKDCETFDEARDLADRNGELYLFIYVNDEAGSVLYEAGCHPQQLERIQKLNQEPPTGSKPKP
jgi:hypothetical protein